MTACTPYLLERSKKISIGTKKKTVVPKKRGIISCDKNKTRYLVSATLFVVNTPFRLPNGYGQEYYSFIFNGGTLYNDAATNIIWVENKLSLGSSETFLGKERLNNGFGSNSLLIYLTYIRTTVFLHLRNYVWNVTPNIKGNISLKLENSIRTKDQKEQYKLSCIWQ